jgi:hypothetical protein
MYLEGRVEVIQAYELLLLVSGAITKVAIQIPGQKERGVGKYFPQQGRRLLKFIQ